MAKKCIECSEEAKFKIKNTSEYYCEDCALEEFGDLALLVNVEEEAQQLKEFVGKQLAPQEIEIEENKESGEDKENKENNESEGNNEESDKNKEQNEDVEIDSEENNEQDN